MACEREIKISQHDRLFDLLELKSAKTVEEATAEALKAIDLTLDQVTVTVIDEGAKGKLFGFGARPAKVRVEKKPEPEDIVKNFLRDVTLAMGLAVKIETNRKGRFLYADLSGENMGILIGKHGVTLDSLQYITNLTLSRHGTREVSVVIDTEGYRKRRKDTLESLARSLSRKVKETRKSMKLEPMSRYERHIIHNTLQHDRQIRTFSEGNDPYRHVVIALKNDK